MGVNRSTVYQWVNEVSDPLAEAVTEIIKALENIDEAAAEEFISLYLGRLADRKQLQNEDNS
jgi:predicted transcriptional regulator